MAKEDKFEIDDIKDPDDELDLDEVVSEETKEKTNDEDLKDVEKKSIADEKENPENEKDLLEEANEEAKKESILEEVKEKPKKIKKKINWKTVLIVFVTMIVTAAAVLGVVYYFYQKDQQSKDNITQEELKKEEPKEETKPEATENTGTYANSEVGLNLREEPSLTAKILATIPFGTKLTVIEEKDGWFKTEYSSKTGWVSKEFTTTTNPLIYQNTESGFQLTFIESWAGYKLFKKTFEDSVTYYVAIPTSDKAWTESEPVEKGYASLFAISVYTEAKWNEIKGSEGPLPTYLATDGGYVYTYSSGQATPTDLTDRFSEIKTIIATFKTT